MGHKINRIAVLGLVLLIVIIGFVCAGSPISANNQLNGLSTSTLVDARGTVTSNTEMSVQQSNTTIDTFPLENGGILWGYWDPINEQVIYGWTVDPIVTEEFGIPITEYGDIQYTAGYNDQYAGITGNQTLLDSVKVSMGNENADQSNIKTDTSIQFAADTMGRATRTEDILLDGVGAQTVAANQISCPFGSMGNSFNPPFCNIVMSGSQFDLSNGSVVSNSNERFISSNANIPVEQTYSIAGTDSVGSINSMMRAHIQEGLEIDITPPSVDDIPNPQIFVPAKGSDLLYSEISEADGIITHYSKKTSYISGLI